MVPWESMVTGAFAHTFDEGAVGLFSALEGVDLVAVGAVDDEGVNFAGADGAESVFKLGEACTKIEEFDAGRKF